MCHLALLVRMTATYGETFLPPMGRSKYFLLQIGILFRPIPRRFSQSGTSLLYLSSRCPSRRVSDGRNALQSSFLLGANHVDVIRRSRSRAGLASLDCGPTRKTFHLPGKSRYRDKWPAASRVGFRRLTLGVNWRKLAPFGSNPFGWQWVAS